MMKTFCGGYIEAVVINEVFEKSGKMLHRYITAVGLWIESKMADRAILVEVYIDPDLHTSDIKIDICSVIFYIHKKIAPAPESFIDIIIVNRHENRRMLLGKR